MAESDSAAPEAADAKAAETPMLPAATMEEERSEPEEAPEPDESLSGDEPPPPPKSSGSKASKGAKPKS